LVEEKDQACHGIYEKQSLRTSGYFVSTIGIDEWIIRRYVKHQYYYV